MNSSEKPNRPLLVVLTPVLNEAWILPAFLKATSLWADYIIIADQMSTDGTREIIAEFNRLNEEMSRDKSLNESHMLNDGHYCEVRMIDNPRKDMHMAATRRLLFDEAKKIEGDKILFALDADEFLSGDFPNTEGWKTIVNSKPGDVFYFRWMNLTSDPNQYTLCDPLYWAAHLDNNMLDGDYPDNFIHELRLPWPKDVQQEYYIEDIRFIHFARVNVKRQRNKERFYQVSQSSPLAKYSGISFYRSYHHEVEAVRFEVPKDAYIYYTRNGINVKELLDLQDDGAHYTRSVMNLIEKKGFLFFRKLDVWDSDFLKNNYLPDPYRWIDRVMRSYLHMTRKISDNKFVRGIDYFLKKIY